MQDTIFWYQTDAFALACGITFYAAVTYFIWSSRKYVRSNFKMSRKRGVFWYKWKSEPPQHLINYSPLTGIKQCPCPPFGARSAWVGYLLHQVFAWSVIYLQQTTLSNNGMKVDVNFCKNPSEETNWCNFKAEIHPLHLVALVGNGFFVVLHLLQTRKYYDGLAYDVGENASQISVIFLVVTVLFMETSERGLFFGSPVVDFSSYSVAFVRKYHGYFFSWAITFTFWYHPCESTHGHLAGFFYSFCIMLQGSLPYTQVHVWRWWRVCIELGVCAHGAIVAYFTQKHPTLWRMFFFGFLLVFVCTQQYGVIDSLPVQLIIIASYICLAVLVYSYQKASLKDLNEFVRIGTIEYTFVFIVYGISSIAVTIVGEKNLKNGKPHSICFAVILFTLVMIMLTMCLSELFEIIARRMARSAGSHSDDKTKTLIRIRGKTYNITNFLQRHPGGKSILLKYTLPQVADATLAFESQGHSKYAEELLTSMIHDPYADIGGNKMNLIPPSDGKLQSVEEKETKCVNARTPLL